jgi:hypothetical protein
MRRGYHGRILPKHGMHRHPVYKVWEAMIQRCTNPRNKSYPNYGGRGITVCEAWRSDFAAFYRDMGPRPDGLTLERLDVDGNYEPSNCCWATYSEQNANRRQRTECRNGHPWKPETTAQFTLAATGKRVRRCLVCRAAREANSVRVLSPGVEADQ